MYKQIIIKDSTGHIEQVIDIGPVASHEAPINTKYWNYHLMKKEYYNDNSKNSGTIEFNVCEGRLKLLKAIIDDLELRNKKNEN